MVCFDNKFLQNRLGFQRETVMIQVTFSSFENLHWHGNKYEVPRLVSVSSVISKTWF